MKVELLPSTVGQPVARQFSIAALVNDSVAIDAGTIGLLWPVERQLKIRDVFLSHSHLDHIASLPLFLDNVYVTGPECPSVYGSEHTLRCLRQDVFNDRLWPDFIRLSRDESPFLDLRTLQSGVKVELPCMHVTPVQLNHVVPTMGFILEEADCSVAFVSDTSPTEQIWKFIARAQNLRAVFLECSFPNSHRWLADKSGHLCPELFDGELRNLADNVAVIAYHLKPCFFDEIVQELSCIHRENLEVGIPGREYFF